MFDNPTIVLIDADSMAYIVCVSNQEEDDFSVHKDKIRSWVDSICLATGASKYALFLTMGKSFRNEKYESYKAKRKSVHVKFLNDLKWWMINELGALHVPRYEADDLLHIYGTHFEKKGFTVKLSYIDKDLKQLKWDHYNYKTAEYTEWDESQAFEFYLEQLIVGDSVDNVAGIPGKGPVFVEKNRDSINTIHDVMGLYIQHYKSMTVGIDEFNKSVQLLTLVDAFMEPQEAELEHLVKDFILDGGI